MSKKQKRIFWPAILIVLVASGALVFVAARATTTAESGLNGLSGVRVKAALQSQNASQIRAPRNLSLQPEAFKLARLLGHRFAPGQREQSVLVGTVTIGNEQREVRLVRQQTDDGERVEITLTGTPGSLTWEAAEGSLAGGARADATNRALVERLVLDSPDQFALAQLRGASYYTLARYARPAGIGDDYSGPLWNIVRVDDPQHDDERKPQSPWRLYYLNTTTGLIDRIVSQVSGETIEAEISSWTDQNGEKVPLQITWTRNGQTIMQYRLTSFSHHEQ